MAESSSPGAKERVHAVVPVSTSKAWTRLATLLEALKKGTITLPSSIQAARQDSARTATPRSSSRTTRPR